MGFSHINCITKKYDNIKNITKKNNENLYEFLNRCSNLNKEEYSLIYSLLMRCAYGGKEHDIEMLKYYAFLWYDRFNKNTKSINRMRIKPINIYVKDLELEDWDLSAIDFHCCPNILDYVSKKYPEYDKKEIKKIIWINLSSINNRIENKIYNQEAWDKINTYINKSQKYLLESNY